MCVLVYLRTYEDIKKTHEDINKTPIYEIMGQNTNDLITYMCVPNKRNKKRKSGCRPSVTQTTRVTSIPNT